MKLNKNYIISLGGSLIVPDEVDVDFLRNFKKLLVKHKGKLIIATGGGKTARRYANAARQFPGINKDDLDWLGIHSIKINALLLSQIFKNNKHVIIRDMAEARPGHSSDFDAVLYADKFKIHTIINLSNVDYIYDKNPKNHPEAKPIKRILWKNLRKIVGNRWDPSMNTPFDPAASRYAEKLKLRVIFLNGRKLENLQNFLNGKKFIGTIIT